ncbi:alpha/beta hydrolase [Longimicrobium terrae]|uniref:Putative alpha/beta superfamily hydrolase n=1 Tax=Longimicrobium terrae TaxID=1639882 RepID=A0A841H1P0_9BACT|nr:alpha/beta hydrolase-fold protein [Longimicrobium terrae]MBB4637648.1 putative alpha/beta superfamily hydrolase [Longimicrobium terrae]MBB6072045.1 putative alpha/beta superfamily hydrolase [Longimicrobium terrae]NNC29871.1 alpha/beta hydrolase [Longimicrobium terrae]
MTDEQTAETEQAPAERQRGGDEWQDYLGEDDGRHHTVVGSIKVLRGLYSPQLENERDVLVYLPPSYGRTARRYPVLYMHDGQNLFDRATSFGDEWEVDQTLESAADEGLEAIVVGLPNIGPERLNEYSPWTDRRHKQGGKGNKYVDWIVQTVKPLIDRDFRTRTDREGTGIAGSSMGGLISLYAFFKHPEVFGFTGVMSPALWFAGASIYPFVRERPFSPGRIYLDVGTSEGSEELHDVRRMKEILTQKGYKTGHDLMFIVEMGGAHNERAWARRLRRELHFLLGVPLVPQKRVREAEPL